MRKGYAGMFHQRTIRNFVVLVITIVMCGFGQSTITFDIDGAKTVIPREIFGVLMERLGRQWTGQGSSGIFVGTGSSIPNIDGMRKDVLEGFKECGVGCAEWPGGCAANSYSWSANKRPGNDVGVDRFIRFCKETGAEAVIAGKPTGNDAASNLAFCKYIIDSLGYPLKYFKVGNEVWGCGGDQEVNGYISNYTTNYNKLKDYFAAKKVSIIAGTDLIGNNGWLNTMVQKIGSQIDGVEVHDYLYFPKTYSSTNITTAQYWDIVDRAYNKQIAPRIEEILAILDQRDPEKRIKIIEDEWGNWFKHTGDGWMQYNTILDALAAGEQLHVFMQRADRLQMACLAQGVSVIQSLININTSGVLVKTPTFYVFKLYKPHHANNAKLVPVTASSYQKVNNIQAVTACATVDDSGMVNISCTNVDMTDTREVKVTLTSTNAPYAVGSAEIVSGAAINTGNDFGKSEEVNIQPLAASSYTLNGNVLSVTLPKLSIAMIRLKPQGTAVQKAGVLPGTVRADMFSVKAGAHGTVCITSSAYRNTPVTMSLYSADGRTLINRVTRTFTTVNRTVVLGNNVHGKGVYLLKINGGDATIFKQFVVAR
jgi:alpha-N-arabinofuranosidase